MLKSRIKIKSAKLYRKVEFPKILKNIKKMLQFCNKIETLSIPLKLFYVYLILKRTNYTAVQRREMCITFA